MPASEAGRAMRAKIASTRLAARPLNDKVIEMGMAGQMPEATALLMKEANPATIKWQEAIEENIALQESANLKQYEEASADYVQARAILIGSNIFCICLAVVLAWLVTRSIVSQLGAEPSEAASLAQGVAEGDLTTRITLKPGDTHSMMAQLKVMQDSLVNVVASVRQGSESVATASAEIAQGNHDLSARTEQQASALEETAASMEELSSTVKQNADSARQANQLAMNASTVAVRGGEVVNQVVETMKGINDSSRKISDIISVIDGIAFQTNILALNAAVEAARAGEQGRGFAVVASEVRSLAGRSAEAAKEIKSLISASVERVEHGTALVDQAGITMTEVVTSIRRVTDIMGEISAASAEQSAGVSQVGEAVVQMDQATQQNAALVEQMAAAASSLKSQAQDLVGTVAVFKLGQQGPGYVQAPVTRQYTPNLPSPAKKTYTARPGLSSSAPTRAAPKRPSLAAPVAAKPASPASGVDDWETF
jgi:methyl-accepting chemotaxis protein